MNADINIEFSDDVPEEAQNAIAIVAVLEAFCQLAKALGLTKEQAVERVGMAVARSWED